MSLVIIVSKLDPPISKRLCKNVAFIYKFFGFDFLAKLKKMTMNISKLLILFLTMNFLFCVLLDLNLHDTSCTHYPLLSVEFK